jgi:hypothetical protein
MVHAVPYAFILKFGGVYRTLPDGYVDLVPYNFWVG